MRGQLLLAIFLLTWQGASAAEDKHNGTKVEQMSRVVFEVDKLDGGGSGKIVMIVHEEWAPLGAFRFLDLINAKFFDGSAFFRVVPHFVAQFGISMDPGATQMWQNWHLNDEEVKTTNIRGRVSFASAGPNSRTTQAFINLKDNAPLDPHFPPFAEVVEGMDLLEKIYSGYGDAFPMGTGPDPARLVREGGNYLTTNFSLLTTIKYAYKDDSWLPESLEEFDVTPIDDVAAGWRGAPVALPWALALVLLAFVMGGIRLRAFTSRRKEEAALAQNDIIDLDSLVE